MNPYLTSGLILAAGVGLAGCGGSSSGGSGGGGGNGSGNELPSHGSVELARALTEDGSYQTAYQGEEDWAFIDASNTDLGGQSQDAILVDTAYLYRVLSQIWVDMHGYVNGVALGMPLEELLIGVGTPGDWQCADAGSYSVDGTANSATVNLDDYCFVSAIDHREVVLNGSFSWENASASPGTGYTADITFDLDVAWNEAALQVRGANAAIGAISTTARAVDITLDGQTYRYLEQEVFADADSAYGAFLAYHPDLGRFRWEQASFLMLACEGGTGTGAGTIRITEDAHGADFVAESQSTCDWHEISGHDSRGAEAGALTPVQRQWMDALL